MALRLEDKQALVAEVKEVAANSLSAIAAGYRGMTVAQMTEFRVKARNEGVYVRVVKNTLAKPPVFNYYPPGTFPPPHEPMILATLSDIPKKHYCKKRYSRTVPIKNT